MEPGRAVADTATRRRLVCALKIDGHITMLHSNIDNKMLITLILYATHLHLHSLLYRI
jgi:hypothetical protein